MCQPSRPAHHLMVTSFLDLSGWFLAKGWQLHPAAGAACCDWGACRGSLWTWPPCKPHMLQIAAIHMRMDTWNLDLCFLMVVGNPICPDSVPNEACHVATLNDQYHVQKEKASNNSLPPRWNRSINIHSKTHIQNKTHIYPQKNLQKRIHVPSHISSLIIWPPYLARTLGSRRPHPLVRPQMRASLWAQAIEQRLHWPGLGIPRHPWRPKHIAVCWLVHWFILACVGSDRCSWVMIGSCGRNGKHALWWVLTMTVCGCWRFW